MIQRCEVIQIDGEFSTDGTSIFNTVSGEVIPEDEPRMLFRARDQLFLETLEDYRSRCAFHKCKASHLEALDKRIQEFKRYAASHPERMKQPGITEHIEV